MRKGSKKQRLTFDIPSHYSTGGALSPELIKGATEIAGMLGGDSKKAEKVEKTGNTQLDFYNSQMQHADDVRGKVIGNTVGAAAGIAASIFAPPLAPAAFGLGKKLGTGASNLFSHGGKLTYYNAGGTHEQNANGGVILGNTGNSVEEGEYRMGDKVLSKKLGFADLMKKWENKLKLRPNDTLSKELIAQKFDKLYEQQEAFKKQAQVQAQEQTMYAAYGGKLGFGGVGELDNPTLPALPNTALPPADSLKATVNKFAAPDSNGGMNLNPTMFNVAGTTQTVNPDGTISRTIPGIKPIGNQPQFTGVPNNVAKPTSTYRQEGNKYYQTIAGGQGTKEFPISESLYNQRNNIPNYPNLKQPSTFDLSTGHAYGGDLKSPYSVKDSTTIVNKADKDKHIYELKVSKKGDRLYQNGKEINFGGMNALTRDAIRLKLDRQKIASGVDPNDPTLYNIFKPRDNSIVEQAYGGKVHVSAGGEKHLIYKKSSPTGNGEGVEGHIMVNHPTMNKGKWDTIDLTNIAGAHTVTQGVNATKKWHKENPEYAYRGELDKSKGSSKKSDMENSKEMSMGGMLKRADGSYSQRGLWDNIRANKGSGNKPTSQMLEQEKKIRAQEKAYGGTIDNGFTNSTPAVGRYANAGTVKKTEPKLDTSNWEQSSLDSLNLYNSTKKYYDSPFIENTMDRTKSFPFNGDVGKFFKGKNYDKYVDPKNKIKPIINMWGQDSEKAEYPIFKKPVGVQKKIEIKPKVKPKVEPKLDTSNWEQSSLDSLNAYNQGQRLILETIGNNPDDLREAKKHIVNLPLNTRKYFPKVNNTQVNSMLIGPDIVFMNKKPVGVQKKVEPIVETKPVQNETPVETAVERKPKNAISYEPKTTNLSGGKGQYVHYDAQGNAHVITEQKYKRLEGKVKHYTPSFKKGGFLNEHPNRYPMLQVEGGQLVDGGGVETEEEFFKRNPLGYDASMLSNENPNNPAPYSLPEGVVAPSIRRLPINLMPTLDINGKLKGGFQNEDKKFKENTTKYIDTTDKKTDTKSNVPQNKYSPLGMIAQAASPLYQGALGLLNKDTVNFEAPTLQGINPYYQARLQEAQINEQLNASRNAFRNNANTQGAYLAGMTNLGAIGADTAGQQIGQIYGQANQYNNSINNQNIAATAANNNLNQDTRQREKDASRTAINMALQGAGQGIATGVKDKYTAQSNNLYNTSMNSAIGQMFTDYLSQFNPDGTININYRKPTVAPITAPEIVPTKRKYGGSIYKRGGKLMNYC